MYQRDIDRVVSNFHKEVIPDCLPEDLALLRKYRTEFATSDVFENIDTLFIQHHLGPFVPRIKSAIEDGMDPTRCWFVDIPYSTNRTAKEAIHGLGCRLDQSAPLFDDPLAPYADAQMDRVFEILYQIASRNRPNPLLVVDDGAYFIRAMSLLMESNPEMANEFRSTSVVEQTTRGHRYIEEHIEDIVKPLDLYVVTIARCNTKTNFESPFIGAAVSRAIVQALEKQEGLFEEIRHISVIGFGPVGRSTALALTKKKKQAEIDVIDKDVNTHRAIEALGLNPFSTLPGNRLYELVVGCTGYSSFKLDDRQQLADNAVLASGSSAAVEFNRARFIELADRDPEDKIEVVDREKTQEQGLHATITIQQENGRRFSFLNAGFPVNFDGRMECLPARIIQATHTLLYSASIQALRMESPDCYPINPEEDRWIEYYALSELRNG